MKKKILCTCGRKFVCLEALHQHQQDAPKHKQTAPKPIQITPKPIQTTSKPVQTASKPVQITPKPVQTASKPVQTAPKPIQTATKHKKKSTHKCACGKSFAGKPALEKHRRRDHPTYPTKASESPDSSSTARGTPAPSSLPLPSSQAHSSLNPPQDNSSGFDGARDPLVSATVKKPSVTTSISSTNEESDLSPTFSEDVMARSERTGLASENEIDTDDHEPFSIDESLSAQMQLLGMGEDRSGEAHGMEELRTCPIFTPNVHNAMRDQSDLFPAFGLFAADLTTSRGDRSAALKEDLRLFLNVNAPWSAFICGVQGSGKSYSLSCMLENFLIRDKRLGPLRQRLAGLVFNYDATSSATGGQASEAAYLRSCGVPVRVLVSASNEHRMRQLYTSIDPSIKVQPLYISQDYLDVSSMLALMAVDAGSGSQPLYMNIVSQVLRDMSYSRTILGGVNYRQFRDELRRQDLKPTQRQPLDQRLQLLESFIQHDGRRSSRVDWSHVPGELIIVDLSCPFVGPDTACTLFDICLRIFLSQDSRIGRFVALDEAHRYMNKSGAATKLTDQLINTIRQQRHLGCRVVIATQEPTISPKLLDLCSITLIHRISSPEWYKSLKDHVAAIAASTSASEPELDLISAYTEEIDEDEEKTKGYSTFERILDLNVGQAILCAPAAILDAKPLADRTGAVDLKRLGQDYLKVKIRSRLSEDGGKSIVVSR